MKQLITNTLVLLAFGSWAGAAEPAPSHRPNIILVMPDDLGYGDYACLGNPIVRTPVVDAFKKEALLFTQFHVSPTCSPCRASLMSGRHEFKNGVTHTIYERERMSLRTVTLAQMLKSVGYTTGIFGKWHLGDETPYRPENRGFDEVYIHGGGGIGQTYRGSCGDAPGNTNIDPALWHNGKFEKTKGYCTDLFFEQAIRWMDGARSGGRPFFTYIPLNAAHSPHVVPEKYYQQYLGKPGVDMDTAKFFGMVENIDTNFGRLLQKLKEWGIEEDTLVIYLGTDNGGTSGVTIFNAGMRGGKGSAWEGGTRAPCFFRWPGVIKDDATCAALSAHVDIFPTLAEITGTKMSDEVKKQVEGWKAAACGRYCRTRRPRGRIATLSRIRAAGISAPRRRNSASAASATPDTVWCAANKAGSCTTSSRIPARKAILPTGIRMSLNSCPPPTTNGGKRSCLTWRMKRRTRPHPRLIPSRNSTGNNSAVSRTQMRRRRNQRAAETNSRNREVPQ